MSLPRADIDNTPEPPPVGDIRQHAQRRIRLRRTAFGMTAVAGLAMVGAVAAAVSPDSDLRVSVGDSPGVEGQTGEDSVSHEITQRLTPDREHLPQLPPTEELEAAAREVPEAKRRSIHPGDRWYGLRDYFTGPAQPAFDHDNQLVGIWVSSIGMIDRSIYDDPTIDLEDVLRERIGATEYDRRLEERQATDRCIADALEGRTDYLVCLGIER